MSKFLIADNGGSINDDFKDLVLDSDLPVVMILDEVTLDGTETQYSHNLGYIPTIFGYYKDTTFSPYSWLPLGRGAPVQITFDTTKVYIHNPGNYEAQLFITSNAADNQTGSGKNTASGKIKIAKSGLSVPNITDARQFVFCSSLDTLKKDLTLSSGTVTLTSADFTYTDEATVDHNLGYYPVVRAKIVSDPSGTWNGVELPINVQSFDYAPVLFGVSTTKVWFFIFNVQPGDWVISYSIYRNKLA